MTKDEALKLALEYIETNAHERRLVRWAIKDALAQPEERNFCPRCGKRTADLTTIHTCTPPQPEQDFKAVPKEHAPLVKWAKEQKPWVGLTDEERESIANSTIRIHGQEWAYATAIEAKLKEKNAPQIDPNKWAFDNGLEST
jgi:hypothetical protein